MPFTMNLNVPIISWEPSENDFAFYEAEQTAFMRLFDPFENCLDVFGMAREIDRIYAIARKEWALPWNHVWTGLQEEGESDYVYALEPNSIAFPRTPHSNKAFTNKYATYLVWHEMAHLVDIFQRGTAICNFHDVYFTEIYRTIAKLSGQPEFSRELKIQLKRGAKMKSKEGLDG